jgi:hypothetical protein
VQVVDRLLLGKVQADIESFRHGVGGVLGGR